MVTTLEKQINKRRLRLLIFFRLGVITLLLVIALFLYWKRDDLHISDKSIYFFYLIIAATYLLSLIYALLLKFVQGLRINVYVQAFFDIIIITSLVYMMGSLRSNYSVLYTMIIIYAAIFQGRKGALIAASMAGIAYGLLLDFEFYKLIPSISTVDYDYKLVPGDIIVRIVIHIASFYVLAFLASYVVEQEKKTRSLLEEKESAFNQLDLLFSSIIESVDAGVMTLNLEGLIKSFNRAAEEITGFSFREVRNKNVKDVLPELADVLMAGKTQNRIETVIAGKDDKIITLGCSLSPLREKDARIIGNILIFQDLTEIKKMEQKLEQQKRLALIGEMAAGLAHEMRNPLASITGSIELLRQGLQLEKTDERLMQIILRGRDQLESFVRDFLLLAKPIPLIRGTVLISEIVDEVIENLKLSSDWNNNVKINLSMEEQACAFANTEEIRQVIRNLVLNSSQAMKDGGKLSIAVKMRPDDDKEYAEIIIADTGCGIAAEILPKVFEPFFTDKDKGTGLGLTIIGRIVEGYGGRIWLESKVNQGTTCRVWLPGAKKGNPQN